MLIGEKDRSEKEGFLQLLVNKILLKRRRKGFLKRCKFEISPLGCFPFRVGVGTCKVLADRNVIDFNLNISSICASITHLNVLTCMQIGYIRRLKD